MDLLTRFQRVIFAKGRGSQGLGSDMKPKEVKARDVPVRVRGRVVPVAIETPIVRTVVRVAAKQEATHQPTGTPLLLSLNRNMQRGSGPLATPLWGFQVGKARDVPGRGRGRDAPVAIETPIARTAVRAAAKQEDGIPDLQTRDVVIIPHGIS